MSEEKLLCTRCGKEMPKPYMSGPGLRAAAQWCDDCGKEKMRIDRLEQIALLIGSIFACGDFKAETPNERELEKLLRENGTFWESPQEYYAYADALSVSIRHKK